MGLFYARNEVASAWNRISVPHRINKTEMPKRRFTLIYYFTTSCTRDQCYDFTAR